MHCNGGTAVNSNAGHAAIKEEVILIKEEPLTADQENFFENHSHMAASPTHSHYQSTLNSESNPSLRVELYTCAVCGFKCGRQFDLKKHMLTHSGRARKTVKVRSTNFSKWERCLLVKLANEQTAILENKRTDNATNTAKMRCWENIAQQFNAADLGPSREPKVLKAKYEGIKKELRRMSSTGSWKSLRGGPREMSPPPIPEEEKQLRDIILTTSGGSAAVEGADSDSGCFAGLSPSKNDHESIYGNVEEAAEDHWSNAVPSSALQTAKTEELPIPVVVGIEDDLVSSSGDTLSPTRTNDLKIIAAIQQWDAPSSRPPTVQEVGAKRRRVLSNRHARSPARRNNFDASAVDKMRLSRKRELLLDLQIEAARKQCECFDVQIKYYNKMLDDSK